MSNLKEKLSPREKKGLIFECPYREIEVTDYYNYNKCGFKCFKLDRTIFDGIRKSCDFGYLDMVGLLNIKRAIKSYENSNGRLSKN